MILEFKCSLCSPDGVFFDARATSVTAPGLLGEFCVLPNHAQMIAILKPGVLRIEFSEKKHYFVIDSGSLEVDRRHNIVILTDQAKAALGETDANQKLSAFIKSF